MIQINTSTQKAYLDLKHLTNVHFNGPNIVTRISQVDQLSRLGTTFPDVDIILGYEDKFIGKGIVKEWESEGHSCTNASQNRFRVEIEILRIYKTPIKMSASMQESLAEDASDALKEVINEDYIGYFADDGIYYELDDPACKAVIFGSVIPFSLRSIELLRKEKVNKVLYPPSKLIPYSAEWNESVREEILINDNTDDSLKLKLIQAFDGYGPISKAIWEREENDDADSKTNVYPFDIDHIGPVPIKPLEACSLNEILDPENYIGLDTMTGDNFKRGLITFSDSGQQDMSTDLEENPFCFCMDLNYTVAKPSKRQSEYLKYHNEHVYGKWRQFLGFTSKLEAKPKRPKVKRVVDTNLSGKVGESIDSIDQSLKMTISD